VIEWMPIETAPRDRVILTNDNGDGGSVWTASKWLESAEWSGWVYDEDILNDACPLGPMPTLWLDVPPPPSTPKQGEGE
jgi:hypothetical protein